MSSPIPIPFVIAICCFMLAGFVCSGRLHKGGGMQPPEPARVLSGTTDSVFFDRLKLETPALARVQQAVQDGDLDAAAAAYLTYRRTVSPAKWKADPIMPLSHPPGSAHGHADSICAHYLVDDINPHPYVDSAVYMGDDFNWLYNPRSADDPSYSDEWTWVVVCRMKFLDVLCDAYRETGNEKYGKKALWFLRDFFADLPMGLANSKDGSAKAWRTLEVAIRATSIMNTYFALKQAPFFGPDDQLVVSLLAYDHAIRLKKMLIERPDRTGNHVTTECYGLYVLGALFPEFNEASDWRTVAIDRYMKEIDRVVPPDGLQAELSPSYHYGVVASYHNLYDVASANGLPLPTGFADKLQQMYRAPVMLMDPTGDFVKTNDSNPRDIHILSRRGLELGYDPLLAWAASGGKEGQAPPTSTCLEYAGFYTMRSGWHPDDQFLFFRGGPPGIGHAEQDMLQVVLKAWGRTLLFDPGKYPYDQSEWRRFSINTPSHNTVVVDGKWQYREKVIPEKYLPTGNPWITTPVFDYVAASYEAGYVTNTYDSTRQYRPERWRNDRDTSIKHTRSVVYLKPYYALVFDELDGRGQHTYDAHFHMDAPAAEHVPDENAVFSNRTDSVQIGLFALEREYLQTEIIQGQRDPLLGWMPSEHRPIPTARFRKQQQAPAVFSTFLYPYKGEKPQFTAKEIGIKNSNIWAQFLKTSEEQAEIVLIKGKADQRFSFSSKLVGKVESKASGLIIRKPENREAGMVLIGGWGMSSYKDREMEITLSEPASINFINDTNYIKIANLGEKPVDMTVVFPFNKAVTLLPGTWVGISRKSHKNVDEPTLFSSP